MAYTIKLMLFRTVALAGPISGLINTWTDLSNMAITLKLGNEHGQCTACLHQLFYLNKQDRLGTVCPSHSGSSGNPIHRPQSRLDSFLEWKAQNQSGIWDIKNMLSSLFTLAFSPGSAECILSTKSCPSTPFSALKGPSPFYPVCDIRFPKQALKAHFCTMKQEPGTDQS